RRGRGLGLAIRGSRPPGSQRRAARRPATGASSPRPRADAEAPLDERQLLGVTVHLPVEGVHLPGQVVDLALDPFEHRLVVGVLGGVLAAQLRHLHDRPDQRRGDGGERCEEVDVHGSATRRSVARAPVTLRLPPELWYTSNVTTSPGASRISSARLIRVTPPAPVGGEKLPPGLTVAPWIWMRCAR